MYCSNCGKQLDENTRFCPACGERVEAELIVIDNDVLESENVKLQQMHTSKRKKRAKKKSCLGRIAKWIAIIYVVSIVLGIFLGDSEEGESDDINISDNTEVMDETKESLNNTSEETGNDNEKQEKAEKNMDELPIYSMDYLEAYIEYYDIDIPEKIGKSKMEKALTMDGEGVQVRASGDEQVRYVATSEESEYFYVGKMKDNKPHGLGRIMKIVSAVEYESEYGVLISFDEYYYAENDSQLYAVVVYAGEFEEGYYSGYGWEFITPFTNTDELYNSIYRRDLGENYVRVGDDIQENILATCSPVQYMGEFKKGLYDGDGIKISYAIREIPLSMTEDEIIELFGERLDREIGFDIGKFKKGRLNGDVKQYLKGHLYYEGFMDDGVMDKEGTLYYMGTDQKRYKGKFRNGYYHGKGTLYSEDGDVIYKGKWDMGDYAS